MAVQYARSALYGECAIHSDELRQVGQKGKETSFFCQARRHVAQPQIWLYLEK